MWFLTLLLGILAGRYLWQEVENYIHFQHKKEISIICSKCGRDVNEI